MGRPPIGKRAMTGAERVRRHRLKQRTKAFLTRAIARLQARIRELEAELQSRKEGY